MSTHITDEQEREFLQAAREVNAARAEAAREVERQRAEALAPKREAQDKEQRPYRARIAAEEAKAKMAGTEHREWLVDRGLEAYHASEPGSFDEIETKYINCYIHYWGEGQPPRKVAAMLSVTNREVRRFASAGAYLLRGLDKPRTADDISGLGLPSGLASRLRSEDVHTISALRDWANEQRRDPTGGIGPKYNRVIFDAVGVDILGTKEKKSERLHVAPRCATCKHMVRRAHHNAPDSHYCAAAGLLAWWDNHRDYEPINPDMFALSGSENAYLEVSPTFGCILHEART